MPHRYLFRSEWRIAAPPDDVYAALADVASYPSWWHQVRSARWLDANSGELVCRSLLPYELRLVITREIEDPVGRILRAHMVGDLSGESQWTVTGQDGGSRAVLDENVAVGKGMVRAAGVLARPALKFNHGLMMRSGEAGLRRLLET